MRSHHTHGRSFGRPGGWQQAHQPDAADAPDWFAGRLPDDWFTGDPKVIVDREEITVIGKLPADAKSEKDPADARSKTGEAPESEESDAHGAGRAARFREETRGKRMQIADEAQARYGRTVSWGVEGGDERIMYTHIA